jgi:F0F1-type ATP synthase assembly protein I
MADEPKDRDTPSESSKAAENLRNTQVYLDAVWQLVGGVGLGVAVGYWLDKRFHTSPWLLVVGSMLGMTAGFVALFRSMGSKR